MMTPSTLIDTRDFLDNPRISPVPQPEARSSGADASGRLSSTSRAAVFF
jgi:hypothetical protein